MTSFQHVSAIGHKDRFSSLEDNIKSFLDWSFLKVGGFVNVTIPTSGLSGTGNFQTLKVVNDPAVATGKIWEAPRKDWVYENNIVYNNESPVAISGIYLNNTFLPGPSGTGNYTYTINYPLGRIQFDNLVSPNSLVQCEYSYRYIQTYKSSDSIWWKEIQKETYDPSYFNRPSGDYAITSNHRTQLPAIMIELAPRTIMTPYQLGDTHNIITQDILLHVFAPSPSHRNSIIDILLLQKDIVFWLYDINKVIKDNKYPLTAKGSINSDGISYNMMSDLYKSNWCTVKNATLSELNALSTSLYNGIVRWSMEILP